MRVVKFICIASSMLFMQVSAMAYDKTSNGLLLPLKSGVCEEVVFYSPQIVRVVKYKGRQKPPKKSYPVIMKPQETDISYSDSGDTVKMATSSIIVAVDTKSGSVSYYAAYSKLPLIKEKNGGSNFFPFNDGEKSRHTVSQTWTLARNEAVFGLGQRQSGVWNHRGQTVNLQNSNTNICIPYFISEKGYGIYWDNPGASEFKDNNEGLSFTSRAADMIDYYFMYKDGTADGVLAQIRTLTGKSTMFPLWALGYWQCRERYASSDELCDALDYYRDNHIPIDAIVQDWQYWGCDSNWNAMRFMNPRYINKMGDEKWMRYLPKGDTGKQLPTTVRIKTPQEMVDYVHSRNAHLMITVWPDFGPWTDQYKELQSIGALYGFTSYPPTSGARVYDAFNPRACDIYWKYLRNLYAMGFDAWWTDSTEPDHLKVKAQDDTTTTADGTWQSVQNAFALVTNKGIYEHQRAEKDNKKRSLQMTRSAFLGLQHYGAFSWSGDIRSTWETMKQQVPAALNYMLCGIPMWNNDIGGFFTGAYNNNPKNPALQELQVRWMQWGCFMPLMRNHCSGPMVNEIYRFGKKGDWAYDIQEKFIHLRYRLLPYLYSHLGMCYLNDDVMMRPLMMDFNTDRTAVGNSRAYMLGHSILVQPVTENLYTWQDDRRQGHLYYDNVEKQTANVKVYLPKGVKWYDFWNNSLYDGGREIMWPCPIGVMPVFVKAGSIVPFGPAVEYATQKKWDTLELRVYPGADGDYILYEDAGDGYDYEQGAYTTINIHWNDTDKKLVIGERLGKYKEMLKNRRFKILLINDNAPGGDIEPQAYTTTVDYDGKEKEVSLF